MNALSHPIDAPCRAFLDGESTLLATASAEDLKKLVNQPLDVRLLPMLVDYIYKDPLRAAMLPPMIQLATTSEGGAEEVGTLSHRNSKVSENVCIRGGGNTSRTESTIAEVVEVVTRLFDPPCCLMSGGKEA